MKAKLLVFAAILLVGAFCNPEPAAAHDDPHTWRFDFNQDWKVSSIDLSLASQNFGTPCIDSYYDATGDGKCDSIDLSQISQHYSFNPYRDKYDLPMDSAMWWNVPIGSNATRESAGFTRSTWVKTDRIQFFREAVGLPTIPLYLGRGSCFTRTGVTPDYEFTIDLSSWIDPGGEAGNGIVAFERLDNTVLVTQPTFKCQDAGGTYLINQWPASIFSPDSIYGSTDPGGHGGSHIGGYTGTITERDVKYSPIMRHALALNIYCGTYCDSGGQEVWPATTVDACWQTCYGGSNPDLTMGSLLALPVDFPCTYGSTPQQWLCQTLKSYGAYVVDDTFASETFAFSMEQDARLAFEARWGFHPSQNSSATGAAADYYNAVMDMIEALDIITNNGPTNVGGGGTPVGSGKVASAIGN